MRSFNIQTLEEDDYPLATSYGQLYELGQKEVPLHYLKNRSPQELEHLQSKHKLSLSEMEKQLNDYRWTNHWYYFKYQMARSVNLSYPFYSGPKSYVGIQQTVHLFLPQVSVPGQAAYPAGMALSGLAGAFFVFAIDPEKTAIRFTLEYANSDPLQKRFGDFCTSAWATPGQTIFNLAKYTFNKAALTNTNLLGCMTNFLGISTLIAQTVPQLWWPAFAFFTYFGNSYYDGFSNDEFWENLDFWWDKNHPWLITELKTDPALVLKVFVEGMSAILLRSVSAYSVAESAKETCGAWLPSSIALALAFYTYMVQFYRGTYDHYLHSKVGTIKELQQQNLDVAAHMKSREELVMRDKCYGYAIKQEPGLLAPITFNGYVGAYYGSTFGIWGAIAGGTLMAAWTYKSEEGRIKYKLIHQLDKPPTPADSASCRSYGARGFADTLTISCAVSSMTAAIGQGVDVIGNSSVTMAGYLIMTIGATINGARFAINKTRATVGSLCGTTRPSTVQATLFAQSRAPLLEEKVEKSRWFCFGSRKSTEG